MLRLNSSDPDFERTFARIVRDRRESDDNVARDVQTILDPFAGSGTTGRAAKDLNKTAVLIER